MPYDNDWDNEARKSDIVDVDDLVILHQTDKAIMVKAHIKGKDVEIWLPKSQIERHDDCISMPEWLANKHGLI